MSKLFQKYLNFFFKCKFKYFLFEKFKFKCKCKYFSKVFFKMHLNANAFDPISGTYDRHKTNRRFYHRQDGVALSKTEWPRATMKMKVSGPGPQWKWKWVAPGHRTTPNFSHWSHVSPLTFHSKIGLLKSTGVLVKE